MSGDVQPRKRKEKRKRKDEEEILHHHGSIGGSDEVIHVHKENKLGGNICAKIVFFGLLAALGAMVGLIIIEYHGANDVDVQSPSNSPWSVMLEGWIDDSVGHDGHDDEEHQLHEEEDHDEHDDHEEHDHEEHDNDEEDDNEDDDSIEDEDDQFDEEDEDYDNEEHEEDDEDDGDEEDEEYDEEEEDEVEDDIDDDEEDDVEDDEEDDIEDDIDDDEEDDDDDDEGDDVEDDDDDDEEEEEDGVEDDDNNDEEDDDDNDEEDNDDDDDEEEEEEEEEDDDEEEDEDDTENEEDGEVDVEEEEQEVEDSEEEEGEEDDKDMKNHNDRKKNWINKGGNKRKKQEDNNHDDSEISDDDNDDQFRVNYKTSRINNILGSGKSKKKESQDVTSNPKLKYIYKIMEKLKKQDKHLESKKFGTKTFETIGSKDDDEINQVGLEDEDVTPENGLDNDDEQEKTLADEKLSNEEEDETSGVAFKFGVGVALVFVAHIVLIRKWSDGERSLLTEADTVPESAEVPPLFIERRQTLIPAEVMEDTPAIFVSQEGNYSKDQHEDEGEEEEVDDAAFVKETYEDLRAAYSQITPQESETEINEEDISLKSNDYATSESEPEPSESDDNEEEEEEEPTQPNDPLGQWKSDSGPELLAEEVEVVQTESETEEESEDEASSPEHPSSEGPKSVDDTYSKSDITNEADWEIKDELDDADRELDDGNLTSALSKFIALVTSYPHSPRAHYGKAKALDMLAEAQQNNNLLTQAITTYRAALNVSQMPDKLLSIIGHRIIDRMRFKGLYTHAVEVHNLLIERFSDNITHRIDLAVTYLMINRLESAKSVLEATCTKWPTDSLCRGYLGLTLKLQGIHDLAIPHLNTSVYSDDPQTINSHFYFHLGDALQRKRLNDEAMQVYHKGVMKGIFRSVYQRSLYNVDRLKAQPWWSIEETPYSSFFKKLESNWEVIRQEGLNAYNERQGYLNEAESLRDIGDWKQFELFARGKKYHKNCMKTPTTCQIIEEMSVARNCRRGQSKFSMMEGGTHVWPHCGPTNCRLRAHLGLVVPKGTALRVAQQTRSWEEGKLLLFDDSFEHEVWHNGTSPRLVLIVDVWHPELTAVEQSSLSAI